MAQQAQFMAALVTQQQERKKFLSKLTEVFEERSQKDSDSGESDVEGLSLGISSQHKPNLRNLSDTFTKVSQFDGNDTLPSQAGEVVNESNPFRGSKVQFKIPESSRHRSQTSESTSVS